MSSQLYHYLQLTFILSKTIYEDRSGSEIVTCLYEQACTPVNIKVGKIKVDKKLTYFFMSNIYVFFFISHIYAFALIFKCSLNVNR